MRLDGESGDDLEGESGDEEEWQPLKQDDPSLPEPIGLHRPGHTPDRAPSPVTYRIKVTGILRSHRDGAGVPMRTGAIQGPDGSSITWTSIKPAQGTERSETSRIEAIGKLRAAPSASAAVHPLVRKALGPGVIVIDVQVVQRASDQPGEQAAR